jgi:recombinational DNA repair ATPase RecF
VKLKRVEIARLRGIPGDWPAVEIGEKGLIIYGPNGVGKSSIIDALEATIKGSSSLFAHTRAGVNWDTASPHVKGGDRSCTVHGISEGKAQAVTLGENPAPELSDWINAACNASFVLRRYMLLQFIDAEPRARYEQIEPFLNLANFAELERGLKGIVVDLETRIASAQTKVAGAAQVIRQTFGLFRNDSAQRANLLALLQTKLANAGLPAMNSDVLDLPKLSSLLVAELGGETTSQKIVSLGVMKHQAQQLTSASVLRILYDQTLAAAHQLRKELEASVQKAPLELLMKAREHVVSTSENSCPVCEQAVDRAQLLARLDDRIKTDEAVGLASITLTERLADVNSAASKARGSYETFVATWEELGLGQLPQCYAEAQQLFGQLEALSASTADANSDNLGVAFARSECNPSMQIAEIDAAILAIGGGDRRTRLIEAANYVSSLQKDVPSSEVAQQEALVFGKQKLRAEKLHAHAEAARKDAVQRTADQVAELANDFYEIVHTAEGIATAKLTVRQATTGSILLESTFYGQAAPPLKYYSESHLDTLGLCFFLAIRKLEIAISPHFRLLLIDDVLHSVDAEHRARLAALLRDQFGDHQIVLVTHDKNFYDRLKATLGGGYKYLTISGWDIDSGPRLSDPSTDLDRVVDSRTRAGKSHDEIAAAAGRFFEWLLKGLTERLQVAVPARFSHEHDIGSMWPSLAAKINKHKAFMAAKPELVKNLNESGWVRNKLGAHDNSQAASPPTPPEVTEFADAVAALYNATTCSACGTAIQSSKDNRDVWRCGCSKLQYGP